MSIESYPLCWPDGRPRCRTPQPSRFTILLDRARKELVWELERLRAREIIISTNVKLRHDGVVS